MRGRARSARPLSRGRQDERICAGPRRVAYRALLGYVLAGHSVGGNYALAYAMDYPNEAAGVALIDSASPHQSTFLTIRALVDVSTRASALAIARPRGHPPAHEQPGLERPAPCAARAAREFYSSPRALRANHDEFLELRTVFDQTKSLTSLEGKPLFVLTAGEGSQNGWAAAQEKLAALSRTATIRRLGAPHMLAYTKRGLRGRHPVDPSPPWCEQRAQASRIRR
jgi:pimeloyl-ACP methyl ester carboxylesterase